MRTRAAAAAVPRPSSIGVRMIVQSRPRPHVIDPHDDPAQAISRFDRMDGVDIFRGGPREDER